MRKGKISLENISGGELTASPLLASPQKYSRLIQNMFVNNKGHITKIPGYSPISNQIANIQITSGIDFKKEDGTSIKIVGGKDSTGVNKNTVAYTGGSAIPSAVFSGSGLNDITSGGTYTGVGNSIFELVCIQVGTGFTPPDQWSPDWIRWRKNGGAWNYWELSITQPETINLSDGVTATVQAGSGHTLNDSWTISVISPGIDDLLPSGVCTASGTTTFDVEIDYAGATDKFKWRKNSGAYTSGVSITGAEQLLSDGVSITFGATTGHAYGSKWVVTSSTINGALYRLDNGNLSSIKNDFLSLNPISMAQIGDIVVAANGEDRPVAYNGSTFQNINLPFGNSTVFTGTGLNDFTANISFTYETATYEVEIDGVAEVPAPVFTGAGVNDLTVPYPDFTGDTNTSNYDVEIDGTGAGDTIKYNVNGGIFVTGQPLTTLTSGLDIGSVRIKSASTIGHDSRDIYEFQVSGDYFNISGTKYQKFKWRKNSGEWSAEITCTAYPTYAALDANHSISFESTTDNVVGDIISFQVDGATTPDTIKWRRDAGAYTELVPLVAGVMDLGNGIGIQFTKFTGHTLTNSWTFDVSRDTVKYSKDATPVATEQPITGEFQEIQAGVQFRLSAKNGHTLGDKWTMPVDQSIRFTRMYPYKNRLWAIGSDKLTVYYSDLIKPTDFTGTGAGYIDFRFVLPQGDELVDIGSLMNYIIFFFKNHIVIYAGTDPTAEGDFVIYQNIDKIGLVAPNTITSVGSDIFFLTNKGVKGLKQLISAGSLNVDNVSKAIDLDIVAAIDANTSGVYASAHYATLGLLMFLIGDQMFVFNYRQGAWSRVLIPSADDVSKILSMFETSDGFVLMGGYDYLFEFDPTPDTYNFNGVAPVYRWTTGMVKSTTADSMYFSEFVLRLASTKSATLTVKTRAIGFDMGVEDQSAFNEQIIAVPAITTNDAVFNFVRVPLYGAGKFVQFDFTEAPTYADNDDVEFVGIDAEGELGIL